MAPPIIGIDGSRLTVREPTGTETYTIELVRAIARQADRQQIRLYLNATRPPASLGGAVEPIMMPFPRGWTQVRLTWEMLRRPPDVLLVPAHVIPLRHPKSVVTIHDVGYLHEPSKHPRSDRFRLDLTTRWSVHAANRVIAVSRATRDDIIRFYRVLPEKIQVIHHGVSPAYRPLPAADVEAVKRRLGLPDRYVLAVGSLHPRKNLGRLAQAFRSVTEAALPHHLVLAGRSGWRGDEVQRELHRAELGSRLIQLGYVPKDDLPALYNGADAFGFPSLYEGFGLPALEALACGVPTVVSNRGALPEVVGDAALSVDPLDTVALGETLVELLTDADLRLRLIAAGIDRAAAFSWDRAARETLSVLSDVLHD